MLVVAGCSSDSDDKKDAEASASPSAEKSEPSVEPAKFATLPEPCNSISEKTTKSLVPKAQNKAGTQGTSSDVAARGSCSWNGLDDNGVKGSQYRWLDVGFSRFDSDQALGSGAKRATDHYTKQIAKVEATEDAEKLAAKPVSGIGEQATAIAYDLSKTSEDFKYATIVARTGNVVVTLTYNGAGYAGAKTPSASDILEGAEKAAKEAVASVATAGAGDGKTPAEPSGKPTDKSSAKDDSKADSKA
ncbi:DUF3558 domain-containing protein [Streptomyces sp. M10(2022)]